MAAPRSKKKAKPKKPVPFPLMSLDNEILRMIIDELAEETFGWRQAHDGPLVLKKTWLLDVSELSRVNWKLRELAIPRLFKYAKIEDQYLCIGRLPLFDRLVLLAKQPVVLNAIQYFVFATRAFDYGPGPVSANLPPEPTSYHYKTPDALWKCLKLMPNLKEISLRLRGFAYLTPQLESHLLHNSNLPVLQTVRAISIYSKPSREMSMFVKMTPNIQKASIEIPDCIRHCHQLLALAELPKLEYLMLCRVVPRPRCGTKPIGWGVNDIPAIADIVPNIKHLALVGQLDDKRNDGARISDYIGGFARFTKLEQLDMTDEYVIEETFDDEMFLDNNLARCYWAVANSHPWVEQRPVVAGKFFKTCPTLRKVYLTRCGQGQLFERGNGDGEVKMTQSLLCSDSHEFPLGFPRVLEVNDLPHPAPVE